MLASGAKSIIQDISKLRVIADSAREKVIREYSFEATYVEFSRKMLQA
jgi:hypothetical protein